MLNLFENKLHNAIQSEITSQVDSLAQGSAADYPDYKQRIGVIQGLRMAGDLADLVSKQLREG